jgi:hypothetical protein
MNQDTFRLEAGAAVTHHVLSNKIERRIFHFVEQLKCILGSACEISHTKIARHMPRANRWKPHPGNQEGK